LLLILVSPLVSLSKLVRPVDGAESSPTFHNPEAAAAAIAAPDLSAARNCAANGDVNRCAKPSLIEHNQGTIA